jgi:hypothetical protein
MKKIMNVFGKPKPKHVKPPKIPKKNAKAIPIQVDPLVLDLSNIQDAPILNVEPLPIKEDRQYLKSLENELDYNILREQLINFGKIFPNDDKTEKYEPIVKAIIFKYKDAKILRYIIRLYLNQYSLDFKEFYTKFLKNPEAFMELRELRKLFNTLLKNSSMKHDDFQNSMKLKVDDVGVILEPVDMVLISEKLNNFKDMYPEHKKIIKLVLDDFDLKLMLKFMREFINQSTQTLEVFYKVFISDPTIKLIMKNVHIIEPIVPLHKPITPKIRTLSESEVKDCIMMYTLVPWITDSIEKIYISEVDNDISKYTLKTMAPPININGMDWYRVNKKYYELRCDPMFYTSQKGNITSFINKMTGELFLNFRIGYGIYKSRADKTIGKLNMIMQDEMLFEKEVRYITEKNRTVSQILTEISNEPIKPDTEKVANRILSTYLPGKDVFIKDLINNITKASPTVEVFSRNLGNIAIYFSRALDMVSCGVFKTKVLANIYNPYELLTLTQNEKLPEIFSDKISLGVNSIKIREMITKDLEGSLKDFVEDFTDLLYIDRNVHGKYTSRASTRQGDHFRYDRSLFPDNWKSECEKVFNVDIDIKYPILQPDINITSITPGSLTPGLLDFIRLDIERMANIRTLENKIDSGKTEYIDEIPNDFDGDISDGDDGGYNDGIIERAIKDNGMMDDIDGCDGIFPTDSGQYDRDGFTNDGCDGIFPTDSGHNKDGIDGFLNDGIFLTDNDNGMDDDGDTEDDGDTYGDNETDYEEDDNGEDDNGADDNGVDYRDGDNGYEDSYDNRDYGFNYDANDGVNDDGYGKSDVVNDDGYGKSDGVLSDKCRHCLEGIGNSCFKSVLCDENDIIIVKYCSLKCIEKYNFKKHKLKKQKKNKKKIQD